ncbi:hypothetical protein [Allokutzneria oryzae]|uniref:Uncharacterized protein n=1 Tax=Allokutzneria oryzae TaxID=1378989 RepID=A0ABV5ZRG0_9PSEU
MRPRVGVLRVGGGVDADALVRGIGPNEGPWGSLGAEMATLRDLGRVGDGGRTWTGTR